MFDNARVQHVPLHGKKRARAGILAALVSLFAMLCALALPATPALAENSSVTGVALGDGFVAYTEGTVDQTSVPDAALAAVVKWRQDALNDTSVKLSTSSGYVTVKDYLSQNGISEADYLNPKWSNALERIAVQRVVENRDSNRFHVRVNGDSCFGATYNGHKSWGEVLAWGVGNISSAIDLWAGEKSEYVKEVNGQSHGVTGHYTFLIDPSNEEYGFAVCGAASSGETTSSYDLANDVTHFNLKGTYDFPVAVSDDELNQGVNANVPSSMSAGDAFTPTAELVFTTGDWTAAPWIDTYKIHGTWTSSDSSVLVVNSDGSVTAKGAGTATLTLASQGKTWQYTVKVTQPISDGDVTPIGDQEYTGSAITPAVKVTVGGKTLTQGTDYTVSYANNVNPGTATAAVTGIGNYTGTVNTSFYIYGDISKAQIDDIPDQAWAGVAVTPSITVKFAGKTLVSGKDYNVSFSNNNAEGTATVTIIGNGKEFRGSVTKQFKIVVHAVPMYRLYNQWSGEHLFTLSKDEVDSLTSIGWKYEGVAWQSPSFSLDPVYRLYNPYSGDHFYTSDWSEYEYLGSIGWNQEGVAFYSASSATGKPIYRLFNRWLTQGTHLFTTDYDEYQYLGGIGWSQEGTAFYSL